MNWDTQILRSRFYKRLLIQW